MNSYPILEFDSERGAVLRPEMLVKPAGAPQTCVLCFFSKAIEKALGEYPHRKIGALRSEDTTLPVYAVQYEGTELTLMQARVGGPCCAAQMEELHAMGCRRFLACGSCGTLREDLAAGHLIVPNAAVRDEGTSYHYQPPAREIALNPQAMSLLEQVLTEQCAPFVTGKTWTTDAIYRETPARIQARQAEGCLTVEMECATWAAVAAYLGVPFGQVLYAGDLLVGEAWDSRGFMNLHDVRERILYTVLRAAAQMK